MTQTMIEQLSQHEYSHLIAYGEQCTMDDTHSQSDGDSSAWISTLESTTYPGLTFGYIDQL